jgi:nicotinate-nucleotide adenylyltransferase
VWWLVSPQNPLKPAKGMADLAKRLAGARTQANRDHRVIVTDVERRLGTQRTYATLRLLKRRYPRIQFAWLMGADNLEQMPRWGRWPAIFRAVRVAVLDRSPYSYRAQAGAAAQRFAAARRAARKIWTGLPPAWTYLAIRRHAATATAIRNATTPKTTRPAKHLKEKTITASSSKFDLDRMVETALSSLAADGAQEVINIDLMGKTTIADRMIVASGTSGRMVNAMAQHLMTKFKEMGLTPRSEGEQYGDWVLVDAGDVIVHLFRPEVRKFYDIERIWASAGTTPVKMEAKAKKPKPKAKPKSAPKSGSKSAPPKSTTKARAKKPASKAPTKTGRRKVPARKPGR